MRILISALLLASAASVPAYAQDHGNEQQRPAGNGQHGDHGDRGGAPHGGERGGERGQQGGQRTPQQQPADRPAPQQQTQPARPQGAPGGGDHGAHGGGQGDGQGHFPGSQGGNAGHGFDQHGFDQHGFDPHGNPGWQPGGPGRGDDHHGGPGGQFGRPDDHGRGQADRGNWGRPGGAWNRGWRDDRRYDWQGWRNAHRDYFHVDRYRPPYGFGWGYRRYEVGGMLGAAFYGESYWIMDPGYFRLPPAYPPYRWVRYYNDALLVDTRSGYVMDSIPDFFF